MALPHSVFRLLAACALLVTGAARGDEERFTARVFKSAKGDSLLYRLYVPDGYDPDQPYPLVLFLHSGGGVGNDNRAQISGGNMHGSRVWTEPENQRAHPAFVLAPQCPQGAQWSTVPGSRPTRQLRLVMELLASLRKEFNIDGRRLYVTGTSLGGYGTWAAVSTWSGTFAAAVPISGGGNPDFAQRFAHVPVWAFHGDRDNQVGVQRSRDMVVALQEAGGHPRYTEYQGEGHIIWQLAYHEPELVPWLFAQHKPGRPDARASSKAPRRAPPPPRPRLPPPA